MKFSVISLVLMVFMLASCANKKEIPVYKVDYLDNCNIIIDGTSDENCWEESDIIKDFILPWSKSIPSPTLFKALYDSCNLYIYYKAEDENLVIKDSVIDEMDIASEDRIEIFFSNNRSMKDYFCLEIDPLGRLLDYRASFYRKFDNNWDLDGIRIAGKINLNTYQVEAAIPLKSLQKIDIDISKDLFVGLFKADFNKTASSIEENWQSWVNPQTLHPDFHVPKALGIFHFDQP